MHESTLIEIENVSLSFKTSGQDFGLFENLNLTLDSSLKKIALVGADGSGKSSFLKLLVGLLKPQSGVVRVKSLKISYMSQSLGLNEDLSVRENLAFKLKINDEKVDLKTLDYLLEKVDLKRFLDRKAGALSGGMKQKLALSGVLAQNPSLFLLDEPTVGVDPLSRLEIWKLIDDYLKDHDATCIFSSAYLDEAQEADLILVLSEGKIVLQGKPQDLLKLAQDYTFSLCFSKLETFKHYFKDLILLSDAQDAPYFESCPFKDEIYLISTEKESVASLEQKLKVFFKQHSLDFSFTLKLREPNLDDVLLIIAPRKRGTLVNLEKKEDKSKKIPIVVQQLKKCFKDFVAVKSTNFEVHNQELIALLGPNGAGKTTTFRMLCALLKPTSGEIFIEDLNLFKAKSQVRSQIGYVSQKFSLYKTLTVQQNLNYFALSYGLSGDAKTQRINELIEEFKLRAFLEVKAQNLPFGIQRQLSMACALIHKPKILFLDEATSGADVRSRRVFWRRVLSLSRLGTTVVVTTHFMEEAEYCDRFLIQDRGEMLCLGSPHEICTTESGKRLSVKDAFIKLVKQRRADGD